MVMANGSVLLTAGAGPAEAAVHTPAGSTKEHQIVMIANPEGHILGSLPTYSAWSGAVSASANMVYWHLFNASGSGKVVKIRKIFVQPSLAATALTAQNWRVAKTSAVGTTGNTAITIRNHDSAEAAPPAQITCARAYTAGGTQTFTYFEIQLAPEETLPASAVMGFYNLLPTDGDEVSDIVLREGEGLAIQNVTGGSYSWSVLGTFVIV